MDLFEGSQLVNHYTCDPFNIVELVDLSFTTLLTSQAIRVTFYSEREKADKFCSEALISA